MANQSVMNGLGKFEPEVRERGLTSLYLSGSFARGEARADSDVDLFCDLDPASKLGFAFFAIAERIAEALGRPIDLTTRDGLHPLIRDDVAREAVRVF